MDTIKVEMSLRFPKKICGDNITQHVNVKVLSQVNHIGPINAVMTTNYVLGEMFLRHLRFVKLFQSDVNMFQSRYL